TALPAFSVVPGQQVPSSPLRPSLGDKDERNALTKGSPTQGAISEVALTARAPGIEQGSNPGGAAHLALPTERGNHAAPPDETGESGTAEVHLDTELEKQQESIAIV